MLQTLALIQNRAGASSEAGRLARAQERELRGWLYAGDTPADSDLASDLRDFAAALELRLPGAHRRRRRPARRRRCLQAKLRRLHASPCSTPRVTPGERCRSTSKVRRERSRCSCAIGGQGFDLGSVASDRLGVRQSIIGRMRRAGGTASVGPGAGGGTEVHLRFEEEAPRG